MNDWESPASGWRPSYTPLSGWLEHAPFAAWLIDTLKPTTLVELGTHTGYSFFAFCEAAQRANLDTDLYAIDTWVGDEQAGFYGEHVFEQVRNIRDEKYPNAHLLRGSFDEHADGFQDGSINILHIDGRHRYEDAKHDYETWLPKLAPNGVILFHDVTVTTGTFGVHRLWAELTHLPHVTFHHGNGLGVLTPKGIPETLIGLLHPTNHQRVRDMYAQLGATITPTF